MTRKTNRDCVIKIQKLGHEAARLRSFRDAVPAEWPKQSRFAGLKERLRMGTSR